MSSQPVRFGLLGAAKINLKFLRGARQCERFRLEGVASRDAERARAYAEEQEAPRAYGSYEELLADEAIEAVYIPLPNALHVPWTERALEAGKHVLCEKPLTRHGAEAERVYALAAERGLRLSEGFMYRHHPQIARLLELVADGTVGPLRNVRAHFSFPLGDPGNVRLSAELAGGSLMDVGCYCVHAARTVAGEEPDRVAGVQVAADSGVDMRFAGALRFPSGVTAHFHSGFDLADRFELEVEGSEGTIVLPDPWHGVEPGLEVRRDRERSWIEVDHANPYERQVENFCAAVRGEGELLLGAADGVAQARALEALHAAAE